MRGAPRRSSVSRVSLASKNVRKRALSIRLQDRYRPRRQTLVVICVAPPWVSRGAAGSTRGSHRGQRGACSPCSPVLPACSPVLPACSPVLPACSPRDPPPRGAQNSHARRLKTHAFSAAPNRFQPRIGAVARQADGPAAQEGMGKFRLGGGERESVAGRAPIQIVLPRAPRVLPACSP